MNNKNSLGIIVFLLCSIPGVSKGKLYFNPQALKLDPNSTSSDVADLAIYEETNIPPGVYHSKIYLNQTYVDEKDVSYGIANSQLTPILTKKKLKNLGINVVLFKGLDSYSEDAEIYSLNQIMPGVKFEYNQNDERLNITIPQMYLISESDVDAPRSLWDQGIAAGFINYDISAVNTQYNNNNVDPSVYIRLNSGINVGAWRFRNDSGYNAAVGSKGSFNKYSSYVQRDVQALNAQLYMGRMSSSAEFFDSVRMDGVQLSSDSSMLPYKKQGFAPVIRGIANSDARVTVSQNGYTIYQTVVPPGPFSISDISSLTNGNLLITVHEANGGEHSFTQFFTSVPGMQRERYLRFTSSLGKYLSSSVGGNEPLFLQSDAAYGLSNNITSYGGAQAASNYQSSMIGAAFGIMNLGAVSSDITYARSKLNNGKSESGESLRVQYAKSLDEVGTNLTLAGYRYSTTGFYDFSEANELSTDSYYTIGNNKKSRFQIQINQYLSDFGTLALTAYYQNFWNTNRLERNTSLNYSVNVNNVFVSANYMSSKVSGRAGVDNVFSFNFSIPLDRLLSSSWVSYEMNKSKENGQNNSVSFYGNAGQDQSWSYNARSYFNNKSSEYGGALSLSHRAHYGTYSAGYSYDPNYKQENVSATGGIVFHSGGIIFSQQLGDTFAIVHTNGSKNISIKGQPGVYTDNNGYAVVPYLTGYHNNRIQLDSNSIPEYFDFEKLSTSVIPTKGAIIRSEFGGFKGYQAFIHLEHAGSLIPFGTIVALKSNSNITGMVDEKGIVYLKGLPAKGSLILKWGNKRDQHCLANYSVKNDSMSLQYFDMACI